MADEPSSEKTEQPTPKKLRDARDEGQVAYSKDMSGTIIFLVVFSYLLINGADWFWQITNWFTQTLQWMNAPFFEVMGFLPQWMVANAALMFLPIILLVFFFALFADALQVGLHFAPKSMTLKFEKLNPVTNLKNIFSVKSVFELFKNCLKITVILLVSAYLINSYLPEFFRIPYSSGVVGVGKVFAAISTVFIIWIAFIFTLIAIIDFIFQRRRLHKDLMMTTTEVKKEFKEMEGDPHIKSKRKQLHRELLTNQSIAKSKKASVIVTNPTHLAVALYYNRPQTPLPIVLVKGSGYIAEAIIQVAYSAEVPIIQNVFLAQALMQRVEVDQYIPVDLIDAVVQVIQWADSIRLKRQRQREIMDEDQ